MPTTARLLILFLMLSLLVGAPATLAAPPDGKSACT
jgi:hypothetical protein